MLYQAALRHAGVHALEHAMFLGFGINMWMPLFGPLPTPSWFGNLGKLIYIVAVRLTGTVLGNVFLWSGTVFYPFYLHGDAARHISPVADQNLAGAIMMVEESLPHARALLLAVPARRPRERGAPGPARLRGAPTASSSPRRGPPAPSRPGAAPDLRRRLEGASGEPEPVSAAISPVEHP